MALTIFKGLCIWGFLTAENILVNIPMFIIYSLSNLQSTLIVQKPQVTLPISLFSISF